MEYKEIPIMLGMAIANNKKAEQRFRGLSKDEQLEIIRRSYYVIGRDEMEAFVKKHLLLR